MTHSAHLELGSGVHPTAKTNDSTSINPVDLIRWAWRPGSYLTSAFACPPRRNLSTRVPTDNETEVCGNVITNAVQFLTDGRWHVDQCISHDVFPEIFVIPLSKPVLWYVECSEWQKTICED
jgi:hypothetical protein